MASGILFELCAAIARVASPTFSSAALPPKWVLGCVVAQPAIIVASAIADTAEPKRSGVVMIVTPCVLPSRPLHRAPACDRAAGRARQSRTAAPNCRRPRKRVGASSDAPDPAGA